ICFNRLSGVPMSLYIQPRNGSVDMGRRLEESSSMGDDLIGTMIVFPGLQNQTKVIMVCAMPTSDPSPLQRYYVSNSSEILERPSINIVHYYYYKSWKHYTYALNVIMIMLNK